MKKFFDSSPLGVTKIHRSGFQNFFKMLLTSPYLWMLKIQALKLTVAHKPLCYL